MPQELSYNEFWHTFIRFIESNDWSFGGGINEIHKKLNLDDTEEGDLIHTDDDEKADEDGFSIIAMWNWERKNYFIKE